MLSNQIKSKILKIFIYKSDEITKNDLDHDFKIMESNHPIV